MINFSKQQKGLTLMEVTISLAVIMMIAMGIYSLIIISIKLNLDNKYYVEAIEIANQKMEYIRNLPYDDVGTLNGSPAGVISDYETISREGEFKVHTTVMFFDDPFDGTIVSSTDSVFLDYKIATVEVGWDSRFGVEKNITVFSKIIPRTMEMLAGYGLLYLVITDVNGAPVPSASIHVENGNNGLNVDLVSDGRGILSYSVLPDMQAYEISVTKAGYSIDQTYDTDAANPNPTKVHLSVFDGAKTEENFVIDRLATLQIKTVANSYPDNILVNDPSTDRAAALPALGGDSSDNLYAAWQDSNATSSYIYLQKLDSGLNRQWAGDIKLASTNFQSNPDIAVSQSGDFFVVWEDNDRSLKALAGALGEKIKLAGAPAPRFSLGLPLPWEDLFSSVPVLSNSDPLYFQSLAGWLKPRPALAAGAVVFVGAGPGATTGNETRITLDKPAGTAENDLLLAFIVNDDWSNGPMHAPSGWTALDNALYSSYSPNDYRLGVFYKIAGSSEPADYDFDLDNNSEQMAGHIRSYRGVNTSSPFDGSIEISSIWQGDINRPCPSHDVSGDGSMLVCAWAADTIDLGDSSPTISASMVNIENSFASHVTVVSADETVDISDSPTPQKNFDANEYVWRGTVHISLVIQPEPIPDHVILSAMGSQAATTSVETGDNYIGGAFILEESASSHNISSITITENGTIDAQNSLDNIRIHYDLDTSAPYDCAGESYDQADPQFGNAASFDGPDGRATSTDAIGVDIDTTRSMCFYLVYDINSSAGKNETINFGIADPENHIAIDAGAVTPASPVFLSGNTQVLTPAEVTMFHHRYRYDDGSEADANWQETENSPATIRENERFRLRFHISNEGSLDSDPMNYRIEYGQKTSTCEAVASWSAVTTGSTGHFAASDSGYITDGEATTDIPGISDENTVFKAGEILDQSIQTSAITLGGSEYTEIEYSLEATGNASADSYCFRLTNAGDASDITYVNYPVIGIIGDSNVFIAAYNTGGSQDWGPKRVHLDSGSSAQSEPAIALTENFGQATTVIAWADDRNGNQDIYLQSFDQSGNRLWAGDKRLTSSTSDEFEPALAIDGSDNIIIAWTADHGQRVVRARKIDLGGNNIWAQEISVSTGSNNAGSPDIAIDGSDNIYFAWHEDNVGNFDIKARKFDSAGSADWTIDINQDNPSSNQLYPVIRADNSCLYANWEDDSDSNYNIYVQKINFDGSYDWTQDKKITTDTTADKARADIALISSGYVISLWQDEKDGLSRIYAAKYQNPGSQVAEPNVPIIVESSKLKGTGPDLYKTTAYYETDATGYIDIPVEYDNTGWKVGLNAASTSLNLILSNPLSPLPIMPQEFKTMTLYVE